MKAKHGRAVDKCVTELAVKWLRGGGRRRPSWEQLVKVIGAEMGGNNPAYAEKVASYAILEGRWCALFGMCHIAGKSISYCISSTWILKMHLKDLV